MSRELVEDTVSICSLWSSSAHLEVDDILTFSFFSRSLRLAATDFSNASYQGFVAVLQRLQSFVSETKSAATVLTKPPEILAIFAIATRLPRPNPPIIFVVFDSHSRSPQHPNGAAFSFFPTHLAAAEYLSNLLSVDPALLQDPSMQWQTQLLSQFSAHFFVIADPSPVVTTKADPDLELFKADMHALESKADASVLKYQLAELQSDYDKVVAENGRIKGEMQMLRDEVRRLSTSIKRAEKDNADIHVHLKDGRSKAKPSKRSSKPSAPTDILEWSEDDNLSLRIRFPMSWDAVTSVLSSPSTSERHRSSSSTRRSERQRPSRRSTVDYQTPQRSPTFRPDKDQKRSRRNSATVRTERDIQEAVQLSLKEERTPPPVQSRVANSYDGGPELKTKDWTRLAPKPIESEPPETRRRGGSVNRAQSSDSESTSTSGYATPVTQEIEPKKPEPPSFEKRGNVASNALSIPAPADTAAIIQSLEDFEFAAKLQRDLREQALRDAELAADLQREFDNENHDLRQQQLDLFAAAQGRFDCKICFETLPEDSLANLEGCDHQFCRDCLRGHISSSLEDMRSPIPCPVCVTEAKGEGEEGGVVTETTMQIMGMSNLEYDKWVGMELSKHSILLDCAKCSQSVLVDKEDHANAEIITCPMKDCENKWCKNCHHSVDTDCANDHSCDGTLELERLMQTNGWKKCPGCQTPTERIEGCNHMTSPGMQHVSHFLGTSSILLIVGYVRHFCYIDGALICTTQNAQVAKDAIGQHYQSCPLFDIPEGESWKHEFRPETPPPPPDTEPTFTGDPDEDPADFLRDVQEWTARQDHAGDDQWIARYVGRRLRGSAATWYRGLSEDSKETWRRFRVVFLGRYLIDEEVERPAVNPKPTRVRPSTLFARLKSSTSVQSSPEGYIQAVDGLRPRKILGYLGLGKGGDIVQSEREALVISGPSPIPDDETQFTMKIISKPAFSEGVLKRQLPDPDLAFLGLRKEPIYQFPQAYAAQVPATAYYGRRKEPKRISYDSGAYDYTDPYLNSYTNNPFIGRSALVQYQAPASRTPRVTGYKWTFRECGENVPNSSRRRDIHGKDDSDKDGVAQVWKMTDAREIQNELLLWSTDNEELGLYQSSGGEGLAVYRCVDNAPSNTPTSYPFGGSDDDMDVDEPDEPRPAPTLFGGIGKAAATPEKKRRIRLQFKYIGQPPPRAPRPDKQPR
ncbi:hypothetical protein FRB99_000390, partial [Tulasnella sp. 403]